MAQELLWDPNTLAQRVCNTVRLSGRVVVLRNIKTHTCNINTEQRRKQELWRERKAAVARVLRWLCAGSSAAGPDMWPGSRPIRNQTAGEEKQEKPLVSCLLRVFAQPATLFFPWGSAGSQLSCWILTLYWTRIQTGKDKYLVDNKITNLDFCCQVCLDTLQHDINTTQSYITVSVTCLKFLILCILTYFLHTLQ